jgi:hypothetical protein
VCWLQTLLVLLKRTPPPGRRLLVFGTTSQIQVFIRIQMNSYGINTNLYGIYTEFM